MRYGTQSIEEFLADVASAEVTPAGGTAAAVVGATGAALCEMVCIHTLRSAADADDPADLAGVRDDLRRLRRHLLQLAETDARAVESLLESPEEDPVDAGAKRATGVPLAIAEGCLAVVDHAIVVTGEGNPNAVPDAVTGAFFAHAATRASVFTVRSNLHQIEDEAFVGEMNRRATEVERSAARAQEEVLKDGERRH